MPFLTAEWRDLLLINYAIEPDVLEPFVPPGVELAAFDDTTFVSVVGLRFVDTRLLGLPIPFHRNFEEVNLRFYVRRRTDGGWRQGVCFIKEIVPKTAIAFIARRLYGENYRRHHMRHRIAEGDGHPPTVEYWWYPHEHHHRLSHLIATRNGPLRRPEPDSEEAFLIDNYWGYVRKKGATVEYRVEHPAWQVQPVTEVTFDAEVGEVYGEPFVDALTGEPHSAFYVDGSSVAVYKAQRLD